ncbi:MAG: hypothetical protein ACIAQF_08150 [Phycisphaerales bacterium JB065]
MKPNQSDRRGYEILNKNPRRSPPRVKMECLTQYGHRVQLDGVLKNRSVFLAGAGPSLNDIPLSSLTRRGVISMAMNNAWSMFRPNYWICVDSPCRFVDKGWRDPGITKFCPVANRTKNLRQRERNEIRPISMRPLDCPNTLFYQRSDLFNHETFLREPYVCWGNLGDAKDSTGCTGARSVMLAALKILYWLGARNVYLIGTDFRMDENTKYAFPQERPAGAITNNQYTYRVMLKRFEALKPHMDKAKFNVHCCVPHSPLCDIFPSIEYQDAIEKAAEECGGEFNTEGWYG